MLPDGKEVVSFVVRGVDAAGALLLRIMVRTPLPDESRPEGIVSFYWGIMDVACGEVG